MITRKLKVDSKWFAPVVVSLNPNVKPPLYAGRFISSAGTRIVVEGFEERDMALMPYQTHKFKKGVFARTTNLRDNKKIYYPVSVLEDVESSFSSIGGVNMETQKLPNDDLTTIKLPVRMVAIAPIALIETIIDPRSQLRKWKASPKKKQINIGDIVEFTERMPKMANTGSTNLLSTSDGYAIDNGSMKRSFDLIVEPKKEVKIPTTTTQPSTTKSVSETPFYKSYWFLGLVIGGLGGYLYAKSKNKNILNFSLIGAGALGALGFGAEKFMGKGGISASKNLSDSASTSSSDTNKSLSGSSSNGVPTEDSIINSIKAFGALSEPPVVLQKADEDKARTKIKSMSDKEKQFSLEYGNGMKDVFSKMGQLDKKDPKYAENSFALAFQLSSSLENNLSSKYGKDFFAATIQKLS